MNILDLFACLCYRQAKCVAEYCSSLASQAEFWACATENCAPGVASAKGAPPAVKRWIDSTHMHYAEGRRSLYDSLEQCIRRECAGSAGVRLRRCAVSCSSQSAAPPEVSKRMSDELGEALEAEPNMADDKDDLSTRWVDERIYGLPGPGGDEKKPGERGRSLLLASPLARCLQQSCLTPGRADFHRCAASYCAEFSTWGRRAMRDMSPGVESSPDYQNCLDKCDDTAQSCQYRCTIRMLL